MFRLAEKDGFLKLTRKQRLETAHEPSRSAGAVNEALERSPWRVPLLMILVGLAIGAGGLLLAGAGVPILLQIFALVLISISAVMLLFGLGGLASAVVIAVTGGEEREED